MHATLPATWQWSWHFAATATLSALLVAGGIDILTGMKWVLTDIPAYTEAAQRMVDGQQLYPPLADVTASDVYRYAPWFAALWIPFRDVPREILYPAWTAILVLSAAAAVMPLMLTRRLLPMAFGWFAFAWLCVGARFGNVEPLMIAMLTLGMRTRWAPAWLGVVASLKFAPILLALVWIGRGEWRKALVAGAVAAVLVAPMLLYDLSHYPITAAAEISVLRWLGMGGWIIATLVATAVTLLLARTRWAWLVAALTVLLAYGQQPLYRLGILLVGVEEPRPH